MAAMDNPPVIASEAATRAGVSIDVADRADLPDVLRIQHAAFDRVAARFGVDREEMSPLRETLGDLEALNLGGVRTLTARDGHRIVGTVRGSLRDSGEVEVGRLAVDDGFLRRGIARALMLALEESFPDASRFVLFTGAEAVEPLGLYASLGYSIFRTERVGPWDLVWLAKVKA
jgi:ribosomal protein S18 acetylase RimI-like enzyme